MKKLIAACLFVPLVSLATTNQGEEGQTREHRTVNIPVPSDAVVILRHQLGSGAPGFTGLERATHVGDGIFHAPQYLPMFPTAATLWPRVVEVQCERVQKHFVCDGYNWITGFGRGEYLFIRPVQRVAQIQPPKVVQERIIERVVPGPERVIIREVPPTKIRQ